MLYTQFTADMDLLQMHINKWMEGKLVGFEHALLVLGFSPYKVNRLANSCSHQADSEGHFHSL